jgi:ubiquinone/menaquinone biosynthesis C-methylase UbiE
MHGTGTGRVAVAATLAVLLPALTSCVHAHRTEDEVERIASVLHLRAGLRVADVGAGRGEYSEELSRIVGPDGFVYATEVDEDDLDGIRDRLESVGQDNYEVVLGTDTSTGLPDACCDSILLRLVYHHFTDPPAMRADLSRSMKPGALIAVIDIEPQKHWGRLDGVPDRGGHGIEMDDVIAEMTLDGFEVVGRFPEWETDEDDTFCVVFRSAASARIP